MTPKQLLRQFGGNQTTAAKAIGYTPQRVGQWLASNEIPWRAQCAIESALGGKLMAERRPTTRKVNK